MSLRMGGSCSTQSWTTPRRRSRFCRTGNRPLHNSATRMASDQWQQIESLYHLARGWEPGVRADRLAEACGDDLNLRRQVEELLEQDDRSGQLLDEPAWSSI